MRCILKRDQFPGSIPEQPILVVSTDCHVGPSLHDDLREYCPQQYLEAFDEYTVAQKALFEESARASGRSFDHAGARSGGLHDPYARLKELDADRTAVEVIFAGGQNPETIPFDGMALFGRGHRGSAADASLRAIGYHIYNRWLADYCSVEPHRHVGVAQVPMWDLEAAIAEVEWAAAHGLKSVNFPSPRRSLPDYNDRRWDPFWAACAANAIVLNTHTGPTPDTSYSGMEYEVLQACEALWFARRGVWYLIFGGVIERYPELKLVLTEQRASWVPQTLKDLDSIYYTEIPQIPAHRVRAKLPLPPSEYWHRNCFLGQSFISREEVGMRHEIGIDNLMWGSDIPHTEGTWPHTDLALRYAFANVGEEDIRKILGLNAVEVFGLDRVKVLEVARRVGPLPSELNQPLGSFPEGAEQSWAFRFRGSHS